MLAILPVYEEVYNDARGRRHRQPSDDRHLVCSQNSTVQPNVRATGLPTFRQRELVSVRFQITELMKASR